MTEVTSFYSVKFGTQYVTTVPTLSSLQSWGRIPLKNLTLINEEKKVKPYGQMITGWVQHCKKISHCMNDGSLVCLLNPTPLPRCDTLSVVNSSYRPDSLPYLQIVPSIMTDSAEYVLVSTQTRLECGPTMVGDADSDPALMRFLEAQKVIRLGNTYAEYVTDLHPRLVLNKLAQRGFRVVAMAGIGQTCVWTCARETTETNSNCK
uniref:GTP cyclohydrolase 1 feedback regulatory protein n=1 Tax=Steinernema glaseri TaxID=37863 RepID=A0A1I7Z8C6_9BILA